MFLLYCTVDLEEAETRITHMLIFITPNMPSLQLAPACYSDICRHPTRGRIYTSSFLP